MRVVPIIELGLLRFFSLRLVFGEVFLLLGPAVYSGQSLKSGFGDGVGKGRPFRDLCDFFEWVGFVVLKGKSHHPFIKVIEFIFNFNIYLLLSHSCKIVCCTFHCFAAQNLLDRY